MDIGSHSLVDLNRAFEDAKHYFLKGRNTCTRVCWTICNVCSIVIRHRGGTKKEIILNRILLLQQNVHVIRIINLFNCVYMTYITTVKYNMLPLEDRAL